MSYLNEVLSSATEVEIEQINTKYRDIEAAVDLCKNNVFTYLENVYVKFLQLPKSNKLLSNKIVDLQEEVESLTESCKVLIEKDLTNVESDLKRNLESLEKAKFTIGLVDTVYKISSELNEIQMLKESRSYLACIKKIMEIVSLIDSIPSTEKLEVVKELSYTLEVDKNSFLAEISNVVNKNMIFTVEKDKSTLKIVIEDTLTEILSAFYFYNTSVALLDNFTRFLWDHVFVPIVTYTTEIKTDVCNDFVTMEVIVVDKNKKSSYIEVFANIKMVINFLSNNCNIKLNDDFSTLNYVGRDLRDNLSELIIKQCLQDTIPSTTEDLKKYSVVIEATEDLEKMLLMTNIFVEDTASLVKYVKNVDTLFLNKKCQNYLMQAQTLMKKDLHDLTEVGVAEDIEKSFGVSVDFPRCAVSSSVLKLLELMETILIEASSSETCTKRLFSTVQTICHYYVKFVPEHHKKLLQTIPQQVAVFYNNCMYISYSLNRWNDTILKEIPSSNAIDKYVFTDEGRQLEGVASDMFTNYVDSQLKQIEEIMKETGLRQQTLEVETSTEKCLRQSLRQQELLRTVWHKVLPYTVYNKTMGIILNSLCNYVVNTVTKCEDISANAAEQLVELLKMIQTRGPKLFTDPKEVSLFVSSWYRLNELVFILNANLLEINDKWADGKGPLALQFKPEELKQLIRALFQNTERRAALLAKIHN